ncbi:hypothetical protein VU00_11713 [Candidatus Electrothrix marina]|uniref:Transposase DDE domain-containing protein n=1 Tax=Candidatus Electrothrix marina TaxID=1859130 RepID=A0A444JAA8_9BACT|nr:hypothetical protein VU00_11713 [Candidatus Electrothrix marina]
MVLQVLIQRLIIRECSHHKIIRPIVRGKAGKRVEFGAKLSVSMVDGLAFVDHIGWDAFNEGTDLQEQVESYKRRNGYYPASCAG